MGDEWDSTNFKPPAFKTDKWDGEDEDDVKDNWDDPEDSKESSPEDTPVRSQPKKKKTLEQIIAEKEEKKRKEAEERRKKDEEAYKLMSPEEQSAEKIRRQKMQEEADLKMAMDTFGLSSKDSIDGIVPVSKEDYDSMRRLLVAKLTPNDKSVYYVPFLEELVRELAANLDADDIKRLSTTLNTLANEKLKLAKAAKGGKKKKQGASLKVERDGALGVHGYDDDYAANEYDDFM